jgi:hypothetical protein
VAPGGYRWLHVVIIVIKHAYADTNDCFSHLRALFGTPGTAAFWPSQPALLGIIPPTEVTQRLVLWLRFYDTCTSQVSLARTNLHVVTQLSGHIYMRMN